MGFLSSLVSATVKTALVPFAVVRDAVDVVKGEDPDACKKLTESVVEDLKDAADSMTGDK